MASKNPSRKLPYTEADLAEVSENPEWTAEDLANARPLSEVLAPELFAKLKRRQGERGPQKSPTKALVSLRLDRDIIEKFKSDGPGWQSRINEALRKTLGP
ncbi:MAG: hypothetical protein JWN07_2831 [Hyphomicrobiales bacterium]|nr:hypothetical protein [Hyphomicrobiales bacterium]